MKRFPLIVTEVPTDPDVGLNPVIVGPADELTTKLLVLFAEPPGVKTSILPVVAPLGTIAVICVPDPFTLNGAFDPLNVTEVALVRFVPLMETTVPAGPLDGLNPEIAGPSETTNAVPVTAVPWGVLTEMAPVVAPLGTVVVICVPEPSTLNEAVVPLNFTFCAPRKFEPLIVTPVPTGPLPGLKLEMLGGAPASAEITVVATSSAPIIADTPMRTSECVPINLCVMSSPPRLPT